MLKNPYPSTSHIADTTWRSFLVLTGMVLIGMAVGSIVSSALAVYILSSTSDAPSESLLTLYSDPASIPNGWGILMTMQGLTHTLTYTVPSLLFLRWVMRTDWSWLNTKPSFPPIAWLLTPLIAIATMPLNSWVIVWNKQMKLPSWLSGVENWMMEQETRMEKLTEFFVSFTTFPDLLVAIFVIGFIAAVGEELLFRGLLQRLLMKSFKNPHVAIWVSAIIFSAIHFQFYGFFPRVLLGALFGYIYFWSGSITLAIVAHFTNNAFTVLMYYLYNIGIISEDLNKVEAASVPLTIASFVATVVLIFYFKKRTTSNNKVLN